MSTGVRQAGALLLLASIFADHSTGQDRAAGGSSMSIAELQEYGVCIVERAIGPVDAARTALGVVSGLELKGLRLVEGAYSVPLGLQEESGTRTHVPITLRLLDPAAVLAGAFEFVLEIDLPVAEVLDRAPDAEDERLSLYFSIDHERITKIATFLVVNHHHTVALQVKLKEDSSSTMTTGGLFEWTPDGATWSPFLLTYLEERDAWRSHKGVAELMEHRLDEGSSTTMSRLGKLLANAVAQLSVQLQTQTQK